MAPMNIKKAISIIVLSLAYSAAFGANVGLVVANKASLTSSDTALQTILATNHSHTVTLYSDEDAEASGEDFYFVAESPASGTLGAKYCADMDGPVISMEAFVLDSCNIISADPTGNSDEDLFDVVDEDSPLAAGLTIAGNSHDVYSSSSGDLLNEIDSTLSSSAQVIFNENVSGDPVMFFIPDGGALISGNASTPFIFIGMHDTGVDVLTATGDSIVDAAIDFVEGCIVADECTPWEGQTYSDCGQGAEPCQVVETTSVADGGLLSFATLGYDAQTANFTVSSKAGDWATGGTSGCQLQIEADSDGGTSGTLSVFVVTGSCMNDETLTSSNGAAAVVDGTLTYTFAATDIIVAPVYLSPGGIDACSGSGQFCASIDVDGSLGYSGDETRQVLHSVRIYDTSAKDYVTQFASKDLDYWFNNAYPACSDSSRNLVVNIAESIDMGDTYCEDEDDPVLTTITEDTDPSITGMSFSDPDYSGTPTVLSETGTGSYTGADLPGDFDTFDVEFTVIAPGGGGGIGVRLGLGL